jgi:hypothetical protein
MKKLFEHRLLPLCVIFISLTVVLSACSKDNDDPIDTDVAGLMAFNLVPDRPGVLLDISGSSLTPNPMDFAAYTGGYLSIFPGVRRITSTDAPGMQILDTTTYLFEPDKYYTVFVTGAEDDYENIIVNDDYEPLNPQTGRAFFRYVNAVPGGGQLSIEGENLPASYREVSDFQMISAGNYNVTFTMDGADPVSRNIDFKENIAYTILIAGIPNHPDVDRALQIRYVENGVIGD